MRDECTVLKKLRASVFVFATNVLLTLVLMALALNLEAPSEPELPILIMAFEAAIGFIWAVNIFLGTIASGVFMFQAIFELIAIQLHIDDWS